MACTRMPRLAPAAARSRETCTHSSRVGTTTSACGTPSPPSAGGTTRCSIGTPKPRVLPVPVRAWPMRSWPASASGSVSSWMANVRVIPASASAATMSGCTSKSLNSGLSAGDGGAAQLLDLRLELLGSGSAGLGVLEGDRFGGLGASGGGCDVLGGGQWSRLWSAGGEGPTAGVRGVGPVPVVVAGSVPAPTQPAEPGVSDIGPGDSPRRASSSGRQRTDTQRA